MNLQGLFLKLAAGALVITGKLEVPDSTQVNSIGPIQETQDALKLTCCSKIPPKLK